MTPLITIVTPVLNEENILPEFVKSLHEQTYKGFDLIFVEGGSDDKTFEVLCELPDKNINIFIIHDTGIYQKMNHGVKYAQAEWLYFMGCDDRFYSNKTLEIMAHMLTVSKADIVYGDVFSEKLGFYDGHFSLKHLLTRNVCHQAIFYRRSVFNKIGLYNTKYKLCADYEFNLRCWLNDIKIEYLEIVVAHYSDEGVSSKNVDKEFHKDFFKIVMRENKLYSKWYLKRLLIPKMIIRKLKKIII